MLLIYSPNITNRIKYIMQYVFEERLGIEYLITNSKQEYLENTSDLKIIYAAQNIGDNVFFKAHNLLFEDDIKKPELHASVYAGIHVLFSHSDIAALNFDVFAAVFYLLSRYEEYLNESLDNHGNYKSENSILFKLNILDTPVVEQWIELLKEALLKKFSLLRFKAHQPKFGLSFDIDIAYAYKNRSVARVIGGLAKKCFY